MKKLEHRLFFLLLRRYCLKNDYTLSMPNGVVCLLRDTPYDVKIIKDTTLRKPTSKTNKERTK